MCGIAGVFDLKGRREVSRELLERMAYVQRHRGPDETGSHFEPGLALAHRRLSVIDLETGQQPLFNEDGSVVVVFNGEIYNFRALIAELQAAGHVFHSRSDTEVIVHGWEEWGEDCVSHFRGMFAFALWDRGKQTFFLARDRLGVKPLFYARLEDDTVIFGSELKALLAHPGFRREIDPECVEDYFALGYVPEPRTIFKGAKKLSPGHTLCLRRGQSAPEPVQYWDVHFTLDNPISFEDACGELITRLREAVRLRMVADVPLGAFLSGGVDSGAVVAAMAHLSPDPVNTCSIGFDDPTFNESAYAARVAQRYRTRHYSGLVACDDFSLIDELAWLYDEPYADSSAIPTYRVSQLARRHVTVALSGDGGDESLAGYRRHRLHRNEERMRALLPLGLRQPLFGLLGRIYPKADWAPQSLRAKTTFEALARDSVDAYLHSVSVMRAEQRRQLFSNSFRTGLAGYTAAEVFHRHAAQAGTDDPLALIQYLDLKTYLVGDINTKVDRAAMAHSLEVRAPLMDQELVQWFASLPSHFKLRGAEGKFLFKRSLEPYLSRETLYRPKMGFAVPLARWFRGPLQDRVRQALLGERLADTGWFNPRYLRHMVDDHQSGIKDYSASIWSVLMFEAFLRNLEGGKIERLAEEAPMQGEVLPC
ncbi:XrtA/PEP-CTERM system amidotransferase [Niveibacterium terrae]|uniref:XrtA/PEP-CTERM system amidotransferase n=1 Tax=Niveibacterium terrae TaxID=3373598 RepID=UPI003A8D1194